MITAQRCVIRLDHSCQNRVNPGAFGDPAVRLNTVVRAAVTSEIGSVCRPHDDQEPEYGTMMTALGNKIQARLR